MVPSVPTDWLVAQTEKRDREGDMASKGEREEETGKERNTD